jgi:hypothetical protein
MPGIRQYQLVPGANDLTFRISVREGEPGQDIRAAVERRIRAVLSEVDVADTAVAVEIVESIGRAGTGAKMKLVAKPAPNADLA